jgi:HK97 family phage prohead protease
MSVTQTESGISVVEFPFYVDFGATKSAEQPNGDLELVGYASTWIKDRDDEFMDRKAFDEDLKHYLETNPILLWQHNKLWPIGSVSNAETDTAGLAVKAHVPKPADKEEGWAHTAYHRIKNRIARTFSVGGKMFREFDMSSKAVRIKRCALHEISVISVPSNQNSLFAVAVKALQNETVPPVLAPEAIAKMEQVLGMSPAEPEVAVLSEDEKAELYEDLKAVYLRVGIVPPELDAWQKLAAERENGKGATDVLPDVLGMIKAVRGIGANQAHPLKGHIHKLKSAAGQINKVCDDLAGMGPYPMSTMSDAYPQY